VNRIGLRSVRAHAARFVMSVLAVALGVAFVTGTFALRDMLSTTFDELVNASSTADAVVRAQGAELDDLTDVGAVGGGVPLAAADTLAAVDGVRAVVPSFSGPVTLVGADGTAVRSTQAPSFAMPYYPDDPGYAHIEGHVPTNASEVMLEKHTLESSGLHLGDRTKLVVLGHVEDVTVVGEADFDGPMAGATIVLLDATTAEATFASTGVASSLTVYADAGVSQQELVQRLAPVAPAGTEVVTGDASRAELKDQISDQLGFVSTFLLVFALLALFVGAFIIANTFTMSVRQRMREFALLRAVGASPAQVFGSIVVQALVVGLAGSAVGVLGGFGLVEAIGAFLRRLDMTLSSQVPLSASTVVIGLVVGTAVSVAAAALPARRAALVPPVEAMRDEVTVPERSLRRRAWAGLALLAAGVAAVVAAAVRPEADRAGLLLGCGAAGVVVGVLVVGPVVVPAVVRWLAAPAVAWWRPVGRLARGNVVRNPRRAASTAGALTIGMALVGAAAVLAASTTASVRDIVASTMHADYVLQTQYPDTIAPEVVERVAALPDVAHAYPLSWTTAQVTVDGTTTTQDVSGFDPGILDSVLTLETTDGPVADVLAGGGAAVDSDAAQEHGWRIGDRLVVTSATGTHALTIGATYHSSGLSATIAVAPSTLDEIVARDLQTDSQVMVVAAPGADVAALRGQLTDIVSPYYVVSVLDDEQFVDGLAAQVNQVLAILYALLGLSVIVAVLGIVNTLALSVIERTREIGLLRAVGLGRLQLAGTITTESVLTAVCGTVVGLAVGVGLAAAFPRLFADEGLTTLAVPAGNLLGMLALAVVVGVGAAIWPAIRAARLPVLQAVTTE
jgi:putative ABC transport system permease protein